MLHGEDADPFAGGHATEAVGHVQSGALLADHDGSDIGDCGRTLHAPLLLSTETGCWTPLICFTIPSSGPIFATFALIMQQAICLTL
jgi:hypothetical protein